MASKHDPLKNEALNGVSLRRKVSQKAESDIDDAYSIAKTIKHPWYRCQALSMVAEHAKDSIVSDTLSMSFESALMCHDENRRVSVACWPIKVALNRGQLGLAKQFLDGCICQLEADNDPISRWCATSVLHTIKANDYLRHYFFDAFKSATRQGHGWKVERSIKLLLSDPFVQKDQRYIDYLMDRMAGIDAWKKAHNARSHS